MGSGYKREAEELSFSNEEEEEIDAGSLTEEEPEESNKLAIEESGDARKQSKPKALEFWESMENIERNDFRYNTIHRMSMGRRLLPKPPDASGTSPPSHTSHARTLSVDRYGLNSESLIFFYIIIIRG